MNQLSPCPDRMLLERIASGDAATSLSNELESHLLLCSACAAVMAEVGAADPWLLSVREAGWSPETNDVSAVELTRRVQSAIETQLAATAETQVSRSGQAKPEIDYSIFEPAQSPDEIGRLGNFRVLRLLGRGGMGTVFEAEDLRLRRRIALKVMLPRMSEDASGRERFLREARSAAAVHHRHVVTIFEVGQSGNVPYLAMELLRGETLEDRLQREGKLSAKIAATIASQIADGLHAAHQSGLLHRDIKPANIWLESPAGDVGSEELNVKLLDFGLARTMSGIDGLTQSGLLIGTAQYLSPEQARGEPLDGRSDLFSLGCVVYRMLTGRLPFGGKDLLSQLNALAVATPPQIESLNASVSEELAQLTHRLLARGATERPGDASEVKHRYQRMVSNQPVPKLPVRKVSAAHGNGRFRSRFAALYYAGGLAGALAFLAVITFNIRYPDGSEQTVSVNTQGKEPSSVEITLNEGHPNVESLPAIAPNPQATPVVAGLPPLTALAAPKYTADRLIADNIPASERFDWQPPEVVAVVGEHARRVWGNGLYGGPPVVDPLGRFVIATGDHDSRSWAWALHAPERLIEPKSESLPGAMAAISPDGSRLALGTRLYRINGDAASVSIEPLYATPLSKPVRLSVFSRDNRWLVTTSKSQLAVWRLDDAMPVLVDELPLDVDNKHESHDSWEDLEWLQNDQLLVLRVIDDILAVKTIKWPVKWDEQGQPHIGDAVEQVGGWWYPQDASFAVVNQNRKRQLKDVLHPENSDLPLRDAYTNAVSPDGNWIAGGYTNELILEHRQQNRWQSIDPIDCQRHLVSLAFSPDSKTLAAGVSHDGYIRLFDLSGSKVKEIRPAPPFTLPTEIDFSPDGHYLAVTGWNGATLYDVSGKEPIHVPECDLPPLDPALGNWSFDKDTTVTTIGSKYLFDLSGPRPQKLRELPVYPTPHVIVAGSNGSELVKIKSLGSNSPRWLIECCEMSIDKAKATARIGKVLWSQEIAATSVGDGNWKVYLDRGLALTRVRDASTMQVWNLAKPNQQPIDLDSLEGPLSLSGDGRFVGNSSPGYPINVYDLQTDPPTKLSFQAIGYTGDIEFDPTGRYVVTGNSMLAVYDWRAQRAVWSAKLPGTVRDIAVHPDGRHIAAINDNGTIYIYRLGDVLLK